MAVDNGTMELQEKLKKETLVKFLSDTDHRLYLCEHTVNQTILATAVGFHGDMIQEIMSTPRDFDRNLKLYKCMEATATTAENRFLTGLKSSKNDTILEYLKEKLQSVVVDPVLVINPPRRDILDPDASLDELAFKMNSERLSKGVTIDGLLRPHLVSLCENTTNFPLVALHLNARFKLQQNVWDTINSLPTNLEKWQRLYAHVTQVEGFQDLIFALLKSENTTIVNWIQKWLNEIENK